MLFVDDEDDDDNDDASNRDWFVKQNIESARARERDARRATDRDSVPRILFWMDNDVFVDDVKRTQDCVSETHARMCVDQRRDGLLIDLELTYKNREREMAPLCWTMN